MAAHTTYALAVNPCATPTLSASPASSGATGGSVTFNATTAGCAKPTYRFWVQGPDGRWQVKQDYSTAGSFIWKDTGSVGAYGIEVDVRDQAESVSYDAVKNIPYALKGCTAAILSANPATTTHGSSVALSANATCPGSPTYRFWAKAPGGSWTVIQDYSTSNTKSWTPTVAGTYSLEVDVRDQGSTDSYERVSNIQYGAT
jgi:hypothetical protein